MAEALIASGVTASASSFAAWAGSSVAKGYDGNTGTEWISDTQSWGEWYKLDLGSAKMVPKLEVYYSTFNNEYVVQWSNDDTNWTTVAHIRNASTGGWTTVTFPAVEARYWRVFKNFQGGYARHAEIRIYEDTALLEGEGYASMYDGETDTWVRPVSVVDEWQYSPGGATYDYMFNGNDANYWTYSHNGSETGDGTTGGASAAEVLNIEMDFMFEFPLSHVIFRTESASFPPIALFGSDDGATWVQASDPVSPAQNTNVQIDADGSWFRYWKVANTASFSNAYRINNIEPYIDGPAFGAGPSSGGGGGAALKGLRTERFAPRQERFVA